MSMRSGRGGTGLLISDGRGSTLVQEIPPAVVPLLFAVITGAIAQTHSLLIPCSEGIPARPDSLFVACSEAIVSIEFP
jgi:hypothetical protein